MGMLVSKNSKFSPTKSASRLMARIMGESRENKDCMVTSKGMKVDASSIAHFLPKSHPCPKSARGVWGIDERILTPLSRHAFQLGIPDGKDFVKSCYVPQTMRHQEDGTVQAL